MFEQHLSREYQRFRDLLRQKGNGQTLFFTHILQPVTREDLEKRTRENPADFTAWLHLGHMYKGENRFRRAMESFRKARALDPASPKPDLYLGSVCKAMGRLDRAIRYCRRALKRDPRLPEAYYNLACYFSLQGNMPASLEHLEQCYALGFRDLNWVFKDPDLNQLRDHTNWLAVVSRHLELPSADKPGSLN